MRPLRHHWFPADATTVYWQRGGSAGIARSPERNRAQIARGVGAAVHAARAACPPSRATCSSRPLLLMILRKNTPFFGLIDPFFAPLGPLPTISIVTSWGPSADKDLTKLQPVASGLCAGGRCAGR